MIVNGEINLLTDSQSGFRDKHRPSTESALEMVNKDDQQKKWLIKSQ